MNDTEFYTATLAKVYADQGYLEKSAEIYRFLLKRDPGRKDLTEALKVVEGKMATEREAARRDLGPLFREWFDLMLRLRNLQVLELVSKDLEKI